MIVVVIVIIIYLFILIIITDRVGGGRVCGGYTLTRWTSRCGEAGRLTSGWLPLIGSTSLTEIGILAACLTNMKRTATLKTSVFNLVSTVVGGGVLSLPFTFSVMGIIVGPVALVISAAMSDFSIYLLLSMSRRQGDVGYEDVAAKTLGEPARVVLLISLFLLTFLCAAAYFVLAADLIQPIVTAFIDTSLAADSARYYVMLAFMCIVGPLSFFKKLNALRFTSFLSIITISVLGVVLFYKLSIL